MKRWLLSGLPVTVALAVLVLAGVALSAFLTYRHLTRRLNATLKDRINGVATEVVSIAQNTAAATEGRLWTEDERRVLQETLRVIRSTSNLEKLFIFDHERKSLVDALPRIAPGKQYTLTVLSIEALQKVLDEGEPHIVRHATVTGPRFSATLPLVVDDEAIGGVYAQANEYFGVDLARLRGNAEFAATASTVVTTILIIGLFLYYQHIIRVRDELSRQSRLNIISLLSAGISHDIKNPLGNIMAACELLKKHVTDNTDARELIGYIHDDANRILNVTQTLLAGTNESERRAITIKDVTGPLVKQLTPVSLEKGVEIVDDVSDDLVGWGSVSALRMSIANIVRNAIEAVPDNTGRVTITGRKTDGRIGILVSDNGPGIPSKMRRKIFDVMVTTKKSGSGIGLPVTRQILEDMQGRLDLESEPGRGTTFTLWIPEGKTVYGQDPDC
jgi:signal transduction histidine kinase